MNYLKVLGAPCPFMCAHGNPKAGRAAAKQSKTEQFQLYGLYEVC